MSRTQRGEWVVKCSDVFQSRDFLHGCAACAGSGDWQAGLVKLPRKILHVLSRVLPADNRSKPSEERARKGWAEYLRAAPIYEPVKLYDEGFRCLMNEQAPSLFRLAHNPRNLLHHSARHHSTSRYEGGHCRGICPTIAVQKGRR